MSRTFEFLIETGRGSACDPNGPTPPHNLISIAIGGHGWTFKIPELIKPEVKRVRCFSPGTAPPHGLAELYYLDYTERRYGVYLFDNSHFNLCYGRAGFDSRVEQRWSCFVPWSAARFIRTSHYDASGTTIVLTHWEKKRGPVSSGFEGFETQRREVEALANTTVFAAADFDGQEILATVRVQEREWRLGTGIFRWIYCLRRPRISKSLDIEFSDEIGKGKGTWKGGIIGHNMPMNAGESVRHCWARYCDAHQLTPLHRTHLEILEIKAASDRRRAARRAQQNGESHVAAVPGKQSV